MNYTATPITISLSVTWSRLPVATSLNHLFSPGCRLRKKHLRRLQASICHTLSGVTGSAICCTIKPRAAFTLASVTSSPLLRPFTTLKLSSTSKLGWFCSLLTWKPLLTSLARSPFSKVLRAFMQLPACKKLLLTVNMFSYLCKRNFFMRKKVFFRSILVFFMRKKVFFGTILVFFIRKKVLFGRILVFFMRKKVFFGRILVFFMRKKVLFGRILVFFMRKRVFFGRILVFFIRKKVFFGRILIFFMCKKDFFGMILVFFMRKKVFFRSILLLFMR